MPFLVPEIFKLGRLIAKRIPFLVEITLKRFFSFLVYIYIKLIKVDVTNYIYISETSLGKFQISSQSSMASEPENPFEIVRSFVSSPATITHPPRSMLAPCQITGWPAGPKFSKEGGTAPFPFAPC